MHVNGKLLENLCPSSAGLSPPSAPPLILREQQDAGELPAEPQHVPQQLQASV